MHVGNVVATSMVAGHWTAAGENQISVYLEGRPPFILAVLSVDDGLLRIRREPGGGP
jgi:hypothetical protein